MRRPSARLCAPIGEGHGSAAGASVVCLSERSERAEHRQQLPWPSPRASLLGAGALLLLACCQRSSPLEGSAPTFSLETLTHQRFHLNQQRGKVVVLLFWNTTCSVCKQEMAELETLKRKLGDGRVVLANVCTDPENRGEVHRVIRALKIGYPTLLDRGGEVARRYKVRAFPTTVVVTPEGRVGFAREGRTDALMRQLRRVIERLRGA
jgi:peroxiredoxin